MKSKVVTGITLTLFFMGMLISAFNVQPLKAEPKTIHVDDDNTSGPWDGTPEHPYQNITSALEHASVNDTIYVYNGSYYEQVVVDKSVSLIGEDKIATAIITNVSEAGFAVYISANNVTVSGFEIRNDEGSCGIVLDHSWNCTVNGNIVKATAAIDVYGGSGNKISDNILDRRPDGSCIFDGLVLLDSDNNVVTGNYLDGACHTSLTLSNSNNNYIASNYLANHLLYSVKMSGSNNNSIVGNTIYSAPVSMGGHAYLAGSNSNILYHNSFLTDGEYVGPVIIYVLDGSVNNTWDNGYPSGGNYWENYTGVDINMDGIGDGSYEIDSNNIDRYPLMGMFSDSPVTSEEKKHHVTIVCNSTISEFQFDEVNKMIRFNVAGEEGIGFCRVCIPHDLMEPPYNVTVDGDSPQYVNYTLYDNGTHRWTYFTYPHSTHEVIIDHASPTPVGGIYIPVNKLELLAPYISLTTLLAAAVTTAGYVKKRKRNTRINSQRTS